MNTTPALPTRLKAGAPGLGYPSQVEVEQRAKELAWSDGRESFTDLDLAHAETELAGGNSRTGAADDEAGFEREPTQEEVWEQSENSVEATPVEEEGNVGEELIEQGLAEADHNSRVVAAEKSTKDARR